MMAVGRRFGIIFSCFVFSIGVALQTASVNLTVFSVGRAFAGLGVGLVSCLVPLYQSESSPKWCRGAIVGCYQVRRPRRSQEFCSTPERRSGRSRLGC